jgi:hypothetical protein
VKWRDPLFLKDAEGLGCPTFRDFRKVGTTGLEAIFIRPRPTAAFVVGGWPTFDFFPLALK